MRRLRKTAFAGFSFALFLLLFSPAAHACCRPCDGYCGQPGVPATAYCCTGIPVPGNACGLTTCGKWLGSPATAAPTDLAGASLQAGFASIFAGAEPASSCTPG